LDIDNIKLFCSKLERELIALEIERDALQALLDTQESKVAELETLKNNNKNASIFIRQIAADTRTQALAIIEQLVTAAIKPIFGEDYAFFLELKEISTKESENTGLFTIFPCIEKLQNGKLVKHPVRGGNGGGVQEIVSILLRIAFGQYSGYQGPYIFDESLGAVSKDFVFEKLLIFLDSYIKELDLQIIHITHSPELFSQISSINYQIFKENGMAKAKQVSQDDIKEMQNIKVKKSHEDS
jgi:hypothetical protein